MSDFAARFVSSLFGNPEDQFSDVAAHLKAVEVLDPFSYFV